MTTDGDLRVVAGIASIPSRVLALQKAIASMWEQVDQLEVVLNGYGSVPEWLRHPRISVAVSQEVGDYADNAKFLGIDKYDDCHYFTIDDDIQYPRDYVVRMRERLATYGEAAAVGVHGVFIPRSPQGFMDRRVHCFWNGLATDQLVSYVGTGTLALNRRLLPDSALSMFSDSGMSDLFIGAYLKSTRAPVICIGRPANWLTKIDTPNSSSLWQDVQRNSDRQSQLLKSMEPWGTEDLRDRCQGGVWEQCPIEARVGLEVADHVLSNRKIPYPLATELRRLGAPARESALFYAESLTHRFKIWSLR